MMIHVGYDNYLKDDLILAVLRPDSSPLKRLRRDAEEDKRLIDATAGRKARSLIIMTTNHVILSALQPETLKARLENKKGIPEEEDSERKGVRRSHNQRRRANGYIGASGQSKKEAEEFWAHSTTGRVE